MIGTTAFPAEGVLSVLPHDDLAHAWQARRHPPALLHADSAAAGRTSRAVQTRIAEHLAEESIRGGYVAEASVADELALLRARLGSLLGGFTASDVTFTESSSNAIAQLIAAFPRLTPGSEVWATRSEWGPNVAAFGDYGLRINWLDTDASGVLDLDALEAKLQLGRPAAVHLVAMTSHRAIVQPLSEAASLCDRYEVPLIVDAAQALGQIDIEPGAAAIYGTGRKWMCGPRGVGYLAVREPWQSSLRPVAPALSKENWPGDDRPISRLGSREAFIAGRVGLATAVDEYLELGPERIRERLQAIGSALRNALSDVAAWELSDAGNAPGAIVALKPRQTGTDVPGAAATLLRRGVLATACPWHRAPADMHGGYILRFSPHVETTTEDIEAIADFVREL
ncbi:aminotransferase class V-fold PLP-dependent enzyme [Leifsonia sp. NPDC058292]|uniref:aminotransferase class V-fold PLP-dependent enzyme n=1 Tax=Leifsonia sp. NPDC058292 TaxID=3346428 RepID=UPI0036DBBA40